jgi:hypothetical protein
VCRQPEQDKLFVGPALPRDGGGPRPSQGPTATVRLHSEAVPNPITQIHLTKARVVPSWRHHQLSRCMG